VTWLSTATTSTPTPTLLPLLEGMCSYSFLMRSCFNSFF
jgi:hypothetical protein